MQKLGGRKFLMTLLILGVGTAVEMYKVAGISESFAAFLVLAGTGFGVTNYLVSKEYFKARESKPSADKITVKADTKKIEAEISQLKDGLANVGQTAANTHKLIVAAMNQGQGQ